MASKTFFKIKSSLTKPTQNQIELVRRRSMRNIERNVRNQKLDAKSVEAMMRIVSGRYSDLYTLLEKEYRRINQSLDARFAQGVKETKTMLINVEQDVHHLESMGFDRKTSGIDYTETVARLRKLANSKVQK